jgi:hypothetical protein
VGRYEIGYEFIRRSICRHSAFSVREAFRPHMVVSCLPTGQHSPQRGCQVEPVTPLTASCRASTQPFRCTYLAGQPVDESTTGTRLHLVAEGVSHVWIPKHPPPPCPNARRRQFTESRNSRGGHARASVVAESPGLEPGAHPWRPHQLKGRQPEHPVCARLRHPVQRTVQTGAGLSRLAALRESVNLPLHAGQG